MNEKGAITKAASTDERLWTVKDKTSVESFIVAPTSRNRDFLSFKCKIFVWYNFCAHSVVVVCELGIWFDYFVEVWKKHRNNVGEKRSLSTAIESDLSAKEKSMKKDEIRKNAITKQKKASNQAENDHSQRFQEITSTISKNPISINQARIRQVHGLIILHFHICKPLHDLYQLTKYNTICFLLISKCLFLSKWSGTQACPPFNMNWFRCQIVLKSVMGAALVEPKDRWLLQALSRKRYYQS